MNCIETKTNPKKSPSGRSIFDVDGQKHSLRHLCWGVKKAIGARDKVVAKISRSGEVAFYSRGRMLATLYEGNLLNLATGGRIRIPRCRKNRNGINRRMLKRLAYDHERGNEIAFEMDDSAGDHEGSIMLGDGDMATVLSCDFRKVENGKYKTVAMGIDPDMVDYWLSYRSPDPKLPPRRKTVRIVEEDESYWDMLFKKHSSTFRAVSNSLRNVRMDRSEVELALADSAGCDRKARRPAAKPPVAADPLRDVLIRDITGLGTSVLRAREIADAVVNTRPADPKPHFEDLTISETSNLTMTDEFYRKFGGLVAKKSGSGFGRINHTAVLATIGGKAGFGSHNKKTGMAAGRGRKRTGSKTGAENANRRMRKPSARPDAAMSMMHEYNPAESFVETGAGDAADASKAVDWMWATDIDTLKRFCDSARGFCDDQFVKLADSILRGRSSRAAETPEPNATLPAA